MKKYCITCNKSFLPLRDWQIYCCSLCRNNKPEKKLATKLFQQSRRELINKIKLNRGCFICGYNTHAAALDFNHISGSKSFSISQDTKKAMPKLLAEIDKCEVLCANCHRIHTYENRHWQVNREDRNANPLA